MGRMMEDFHIMFQNFSFLSSGREVSVEVNEEEQKRTLNMLPENFGSACNNLRKNDSESNYFKSDVFTLHHVGSYIHCIMFNCMYCISKGSQG